MKRHLSLSVYLKNSILPNLEIHGFHWAATTNWASSTALFGWCLCLSAEITSYANYVPTHFFYINDWKEFKSGSLAYFPSAGIQTQWQSCSRKYNSALLFLRVRWQHWVKLQVHKPGGSDSVSVCLLKSLLNCVYYCSTDCLSAQPGPHPG